MVPNQMNGTQGAIERMRTRALRAPASLLSAATGPIWKPPEILEPRRGGALTFGASGPEFTDLD